MNKKKDFLAEAESRKNEKPVNLPKSIKIHLKIEIFSCMKRPPEEIPEDFVLLSIKDENSLKKYIQIFQGWMISSSPSVTPFEHPTYDIWVKDCKILSENL